MNNPRITVIVAVYNAQKTLLRLADSLKAQTMPDFEVLLIDDGSTDSSGSICDCIAESDSRFKVFHKPNEGIGSTRQFGIDHASGDYTIHADSDDWVEPDYLKSLYDNAVSTGADMVICDIWIENGNKTVYRKEQPKAFDRESMLNDLISRLQNGPCNKLIRRSFYTERNISYPEGLNVGEDQLFNLKLIMEGATVSYVPQALYHYDTSANPDSASRGSSLEKVLQGEKFISELRNLLPQGFEKGIDDKNLDVAYTALKANVYTGSQFKEKFSFLSRVRWKDYYKKAFSIKIIIWTSLHISYGLASFMYGLKKIKRRMRL